MLSEQLSKQSTELTEIESLSWVPIVLSSASVVPGGSLWSAEVVCALVFQAEFAQLAEVESI